MPHHLLALAYEHSIRTVPQIRIGFMWVGVLSVYVHNALIPIVQQWDILLRLLPLSSTKTVKLKYMKQTSLYIHTCR